MKCIETPMFRGQEVAESFFSHGRSRDLKIGVAPRKADLQRRFGSINQQVLMDYVDVDEF